MWPHMPTYTGSAARDLVAAEPTIELELVYIYRSMIMLSSIDWARLGLSRDCFVN